MTIISGRVADVVLRPLDFEAAAPLPPSAEPTRFGPVSPFAPSAPLAVLPSAMSLAATLPPPTAAPSPLPFPAVPDFNISAVVALFCTPPFRPRDDDVAEDPPTPGLGPRDDFGDPPVPDPRRVDVPRTLPCRDERKYEGGV